MNGSAFRIRVRLAPKVPHSLAAWGSAPGLDRSKETSALKARFTFATNSPQGPIETRFQRLITRRFQILE
ncbi:MAG: hypothetical protein DMF39_11675 [Verrucomicrobia bacterium]|nr:MAG: hypothetical protein DMF39_11675 [Verrucomicrobiota bacterium]